MEWVAFSEVLRNFALAAAGAMGAWFAWKRLTPAADQANASVEQAKLARETQERALFRDAAADLAAEGLEARLAAIYVLEEIALSVPDLSEAAFKVLSAFLRNRPDPTNDATGLPADMLAAVEIVSLLQATREWSAEDD